MIWGYTMPVASWLEAIEYSRKPPGPYSRYLVKQFQIAGEIAEVFKLGRSATR